jgi:hypothetical protein
MIPEAIGLLRHIDSVYLFNNLLSGGIPISLGLLSNLEQFRAQENQISREIPEELGILENLSSSPFAKQHFKWYCPRQFWWPDVPD